MVSQEAIIRLPVEKGIFSKEEFLEMVEVKEVKTVFLFLDEKGLNK